MTRMLQGVFTALVTPFTADGAVDEAALRRLVRRQIDGGVAGVVPCGTTGEGATLFADEHQRVVSVVVEEARQGSRPVQVIAGSGSNDTQKAIDLSRRCLQAGADALLVVTPYYNKPQQRGLAAHFRAIAEAVDLPIVLYDVPGRTGVHMQPETVLELAAEEPFVAVKEASGRLEDVSEILRHRPDGFAVLSGEDSLTLPIVALGGDGVIAVVSNEAPELLVSLVEAALAGDRPRAAELHASLLPLMRANFCESNPVPVKWALARLGLIEPHLRLPLVPLDPANEPRIERALEEAGLRATAEPVPVS
ncbi:MAG TPA: 4-hydroxy-tetrahydrodipicolinate synthase [Thermoanaerobaculia bacterium]|nr:4-hydroxy-tetrahydrodipicolinate synthase [Thermoanaerobaculia bacterium]